MLVGFLVGFLYVAVFVCLFPSNGRSLFIKVAKKQL